MAARSRSSVERRVTGAAFGNGTELVRVLMSDPKIELLSTADSPPVALKRCGQRGQDRYRSEGKKWSRDVAAGQGGKAVRLPEAAFLRIGKAPVPPSARIAEWHRLVPKASPAVPGVAHRGAIGPSPMGDGAPAGNSPVAMPISSSSGSWARSSGSTGLSPSRLQVTSTAFMSSVAVSIARWALRCRRRGPFVLASHSSGIRRAAGAMVPDRFGAG